MEPRRSGLFTLIVILVLAPAAGAQRLPRGVVPDHYDLTLNIDLARARFSGDETIQVEVSEPTTQVVLHALALTIQQASLSVKGATQVARVALDAEAQTATLIVPHTLPRGSATIRLRFSGSLNRQLRGLYLSRANGRNYAVSQMESTDARRAFPCFDEPALKATFSLTLTVPRGDVAISNGRVLTDKPGPGPGRHTVSFETTPKMSSYLVAIAVGNFACLSDSSDGVPIRICATPDKAPLGAVALDAAKQILHFYNGYYSIRYPFGKLDVVAIPDFAAGAMENTAAIFAREDVLLTTARNVSAAVSQAIWSDLAHEMAHQWFGDLVTMAWWDDLWLNEGFATWMANRPLAALHPDWNIPVDEVLETEAALDLDGLKETHAIRTPAETPDEIEALFDPIAYEKGAAVLRMVERYVGAETFRDGINAYLDRHLYANATSEDFWTEMAAVSKRPVDRILSRFVTQAGSPLLDVALECRSGEATLAVGQRRFYRDLAGESVDGAAPLWSIPLCLKQPGLDASACTLLAEPSMMIRKTDCPPWIFINSAASGYFRTAYSPSLVAALAGAAQQALTAPERLSLAADEWALVRNGRHTIADYLTLTSGFADEPNSGVLGEVSARLRFIRDYVATGVTEPRFEAFVRDLFNPSLRNIGFSSGPGETNQRRELRATLIELLGTAGNDPDVVGRAQTVVHSHAAELTAGNRARSSDADAPSADPTVFDALLHVAARHGDASLYVALKAASAHAPSPDERYEYLYALAEFQDPALIQRGLEFALTPDLRSQDTALYLSRFLMNPSARAQTWTFCKTHWAVLESKIEISLGDITFVNALGSFCDPATRDDIRAFFARHRLPAGSRTLAQTLELIGACTQLQAAQAPVLASWLTH